MASVLPIANYLVIIFSVRYVYMYVSAPLPKNNYAAELVIRKTYVSGSTCREYVECDTTL